MDWILPSEMMIVWSSRAAEPVPSMTRTWMSATIGALTFTNSRTPGASAEMDCAQSCGAEQKMMKSIATKNALVRIHLISMCLSRRAFFLAGHGRRHFAPSAPSRQPECTDHNEDRNIDRTRGAE